MSDSSKGGGQTAPTYTKWRCAKCGTFIRTAMPCTEVTHKCPKDIGRSHHLRGEE
jgi:hypothetical protein